MKFAMLEGAHHVAKVDFVFGKSKLLALCADVAQMDTHKWVFLLI